MQQQNDLEIWLSEPQTAVLEARKPQILNMSGQGGGKSAIIGYSSGMFITDFPQVKGFIGANTEMQLTQSTLRAVFKSWADVHGYEEYDPKTNPSGAYVVDKKPPGHFKKFERFRKYHGIVSFYNGAIIFLGSLENYKAHDGKEFGWAHLDETKDTKEAALDEVIVGRLRQYGLWYHAGTGEIYFDNTISAEEAEMNNWIAWNPLYINTSPALGGVPWLNKKFHLDKFQKEIKKKVLRKERDYFHKEFDNKAVIIYSAYHNRHNLPPNYFENQEKSLVTIDKILKMVHGYPFSKSGGEFYPNFNRDKVVRHVPYIRGLAVHGTWDFNVVPYMTHVCAHIQFITRFLDEVGNKFDVPEHNFRPIEVMRISIYREYCLENPKNSVEGCVEEFKGHHEPEETEYFYYGDASGLNRIPGLGSYTNFGAIRDGLWQYVHNQSKRVKGANIGPLKRRDLLNAIFAGTIPEVEIEIDEDCVKTIEDFEHVKEGVSGKFKEKVEDPVTKQKYEKYGHTSDAVEYLICEVAKQYIK